MVLFYPVFEQVFSIVLKLAVTNLTPQAEAEKKFIDIAAAKEVLTDDGEISIVFCITFDFTADYREWPIINIQLRDTRHFDGGRTIKLLHQVSTKHQ